MNLALTDQRLLSIWEVGLGQHPLDRALTVLEAAYPGQSRQTLAELAIGERDRWLLAVYGHIFGQQLVGQARCPACRSSVEFTLTTNDLRTAPGPAVPDLPLTLTDGGYTLAFRLPDSFDLAAVANLPSVEAARQGLVERCTVNVEYEGVTLDMDAVPERMLALMAAEMAIRDPQADVDLALACPNCGQQWTVMFDIASFLWTKIDALARRLLREVNVLARAYGWREADILGMTVARRQAYLEMVS